MDDKSPFLSAEELLECRNKPISTLPAYGLKRFEPQNSPVEENEINNYLSEVKEILSCPRVKISGSISLGIWQKELKLAEVLSYTGSYWSTSGHVIDKKMYLYPEEALYLLDMSLLQLTINDLPLSIERAYTCLLTPNTDLTLDQYRVYSQLSNHGYKILKHNEKNVITHYEKKIQVHKQEIRHKKDAKTQECSSTCSSESVETISDNPNENSDVFEADTSPELPQNSSLQTKSAKLKFHYDLYVVTGKSFKKTILQSPDYRICVLSHLDEVPNPGEIRSIISHYNDNVGVLLAVVAPDAINYFNFINFVSPTLRD